MHRVTPRRSIAAMKNSAAGRSWTKNDPVAEGMAGISLKFSPPPTYRRPDPTLSFH